MEIRFATKKFGDTLSQNKQRVRTYGAMIAKKLQIRLNQLASADNLETMRTVPGGCHELHEDREGQLAVDLTANWRLIFIPTANPPPAKVDGGLDWHSVTAVTITEVTDYHGN